MKTIKQCSPTGGNMFVNDGWTEARSRRIKMVIASGTFYVINPFTKGNMFSHTRRINSRDKTQPVVAAFNEINEFSRAHLSTLQSNCPRVGRVTVTALEWAESSAKGHFHNNVFCCFVSFSPSFLILLLLFMPSEPSGPPLNDWTIQSVKASLTLCLQPPAKSDMFYLLG